MVSIGRTQTIAKRGDVKSQTLFRGDERGGESCLHLTAYSSPASLIQRWDTFSPLRHQQKGVPASSIGFASTDISQPTAHSSMQLTAGEAQLHQLDHNAKKSFRTEKGEKRKKEKQTHTYFLTAAQSSEPFLAALR